MPGTRRMSLYLKSSRLMKRIHLMIKNTEKEYSTPVVYVINLKPESLICASGDWEDVGEEDGSGDF